MHETAPPIFPILLPVGGVTFPLRECGKININMIIMFCQKVHFVLAPLSFL